jgi:hypothetical protein
MSGILANSSSRPMLGAETAADKSVSNYVAGERITLSTTPTGTAYAWSLAAPTSSSVARSALSAETGASVTFVPDVGGTFMVTCVVDSTTTYVIRMTAQSAAIAEPVEAIRFSPRTDASIPAPAAGVAMYYSSDQDALCVKDPDGDVSTVDLTAVP